MRCFGGLSVGLSDSVRSLFHRSGRKQKKGARGVQAPVAELLSIEPIAQEAKPPVNGLPGFKASAADHVDRRRADRFTNLRMKLRNAFTPSQPVVDRRMFAGRSDILRTMIGSIEDQRLHLVIYGDRGIGKTSLLQMLTEVAREARYLVVYSSCGAASNFQETFRAAASEIPLLYHSSYGPTTAEAESGSTLAGLLPETFSPRQFADVCGKLTGTRVLIILDEYDRCGSSEFRRDLAELIKFLSDRSGRVHLVIGGVAADLDELVEHIPSIRRNILAVRVPRMTDEEIRQLVVLGEGASGLTFVPAAIDFLVILARGWPYIASLLCHHAGISAIDSRRETVLASDVSMAVDASLNELWGRMAKGVQNQVERLLAEDGGKLLAVLAGASLEAGGEFDVSDIDRVAQNGAEGTSAKRLAEQLATDRILIEMRDDAHGRRFAFVEDGLPPYLWFRGAKQKQQLREAKAPAQGAASNG